MPSDKRPSLPDDPAFPAVVPEEGTYYEGLSTREHFAALAMQGLLASGQTFRSSPPFKPAEVAEAACNLADALLARLALLRKE